MDVTGKAVSHINAQFELAEHLPYLFKHIHSQLEVASAGDVAKFGISVAVWRILVVLWQHADLSHRELAKLTSIEVSTLSRISKSVHHDGLIRRRRLPEDQRTVRVTLTEKGRDLVNQVIPWAQAAQTNITGDLSSADIGNLTRLLQLIAHNLNRYSEADNLDACVPAAPQPVRNAPPVQKAKRASRASPPRVLK